MPELGTLLHSRKLILSLSLLFLLSLILVTNWLTHPRNRSITGTEFEGVIFQKNNAPNVLGVMLLNDREVESYWSPSEGEIFDMEEQLELNIQEHIPALAPQLSAFPLRLSFIPKTHKDVKSIPEYIPPLTEEH